MAMSARRNPGRSAGRGGDDGVLPLINVVFLLLIFFMLAGRFTTDGPFPITPAESSSETEAGDRDLVVTIGPDGIIAMDDKIIGLEGLPGLLAARAEAGAPVWVKADAGAEAVRVIDVLTALREAGIAEVRLLTVLAP